MSIDAQRNLFEDRGIAPSAVQPTPDPEALRGRLGRLLETLRTSQTMPLSDREVRMWQTVVPNMTRWLPEDEADTIRSEFASELKRLGARNVAGA